MGSIFDLMYGSHLELLKITLGNLIFKAYFKLFYTFLVEDSFSTLKMHHWLPLVV